MASITNDSFDGKMHDLEQRRSHNPNGDLGHEARQIEPLSKGFYGHIVSSSPSPGERARGRADCFELQGNPGVLGLAAHAVTRTYLCLRELHARR